MSVKLLGVSPSTKTEIYVLTYLPIICIYH